MNNSKNLRWKQRFANFEKAFKQFKDATERIEKLDTLSKEGLIQRFEYTLELAWKTLKDYLEYKEVIAKFPRDAIKEGYQAELLDNGEVWLDMLNQRNILAHTYDEDNFNFAIKRIVNIYYREIEKLYIFFKDEQ